MCAMKQTGCAVILAMAACAAQAAAPAELYEQGLALYTTGHYGAALRAITEAAERGHLRAQEMAGLMRLAGPALYGSQVARDVAAGRAWLIRAGQAGSEVGRRMACGGTDTSRCEALQQASAEDGR